MSIPCSMGSLMRATPVAYAHPDDVLAVFDHPAVWVNGTAIQVIGVSWQLRGLFVVNRGYGGVDSHDVPMGSRVTHGPLCIAQRAARSMAEGKPSMDEQCWALCPGCGLLCSPSLGLLHDGQSAAWCLELYERMQREDPRVDLSISLTPRQLTAARVLWSERLRGLVTGGSARSERAHITIVQEDF